MRLTSWGCEGWSNLILVVCQKSGMFTLNARHSTLYRLAFIPKTLKSLSHGLLAATLHRSPPPPSTSFSSAATTALYARNLHHHSLPCTVPLRLPTPVSSIIRFYLECDCLEVIAWLLCASKWIECDCLEVWKNDYYLVSSMKYRNVIVAWKFRNRI
jgi:hypothetical protein